MITTVFIDIDNTLLDFKKNAAKTIKNCLALYNHEYNQEIFDTFYVINNSLWKDIEKGELTKERLHLIRWNLIFKELNINIDGIEFEKHFIKGLEECAEPVDGAIPALTYLASKYDVYAATNASKVQQDTRLKIAGMDKYIKKVFASEKIGWQKPDRRFFEACLNELGISANETLMFGDSITADIMGGINSGIKTCWFNPYGLDAPAGVKPDYIISSLLDVFKIL